MEIVNEHKFASFNDIGPGVVFLAEDNYCYMRIEDLWCKNQHTLGSEYDCHGNAFRLADGFLAVFGSDERVIPVNCKLLVE